MRATEIIATLQARGVTLLNEGGNIRIKGASRITDQEKQAIRTHKTAFLKALEPVATSAPPSQTARPLVANEINNLGDFQTAMHSQALAVSNDANSLILKEPSALAVQIPLTQGIEPISAENLGRDDALTLAWSPVSAQEEPPDESAPPARLDCRDCRDFCFTEYHCRELKVDVDPEHEPVCLGKHFHQREKWL